MNVYESVSFFNYCLIFKEKKLDVNFKGKKFSVVRLRIDLVFIVFVVEMCLIFIYIVIIVILNVS